MEYVLEAEAREASGRAGSRRLRREGKVPAIVYGGGSDPQSIALDHNRLLHTMENEAFYTSIVTIRNGKDTQSVVVKDVQRHPYKPVVLHLDFQRIVADQLITLDVPIHFIGEEESKGVKLQGGIVEHLVTTVEVSCLPGNLPEYLEVDITALELNDLLHMSDIPLPEGVSLVALEHGQDQGIVAIHAPRREEEETSEGEEAAADEEKAEDKPAEDSEDDSD